VAILSSHSPWVARRKRPRKDFLLECLKKGSLDARLSECYSLFPLTKELVRRYAPAAKVFISRRRFLCYHEPPCLAVHIPAVLAEGYGCQCGIVVEAVLWASSYTPYLSPAPRIGYYVRGRYAIWEGVAYGIKQLNELTMATAPYVIAAMMSARRRGTECKALASKCCYPAKLADVKVTGDKENWRVILCYEIRTERSKVSEEITFATSEGYLLTQEELDEFFELVEARGVVEVLS